MDLISRKNVCLVILLLLWPVWASSAEDELVEDAAADTRVLIDVSGSMKENDPQNLRQPALRLLVGLLPKDSRAGVWTFGQYVNEEISLGKVDNGWRDRARASASKIHSRGLFTNIEEALKRSTEDWKSADGKYTRHVVLLTDGVVDISKNSLINAKSRRRIMKDVMPRLKKLGVKVHTIALSQSADHHLLKKMSANTDGWYEQVDDADRLKRIFLRMFEKVSKPDTVPLKDNKFRIDKSVKEATLLVFHSANKEPTKVKTPSGASFSSEDTPEGVSWHRDDGYDLMTITKPEAGEWQILADIDPDNRVIVVTDLKMVTSSLPNRVLQGELNNIKIMFKDQGKKIEEKEFLDVVDIKSVHTDSEGASEPRPVFDNGKDGDKEAGDGIFTFTFGKDIGKGQVEVILTAEGKTFVREKRFTLDSVPAVSVDKFEGERGGRAGLMATVIPEPNLVDWQSLEVEAQLTPKQGEPVAVMFLPGSDGMSWESWIDKADLKGTWNLDISFKAKSITGSKLEMDLASIPIEGSQPAAEAEAPKAEPKPEPKPEPVAEAKPEPVAEPEPEPKPEPEAKPEPEPEAELEVAEEEDSSLSNTIIFIVINLLIIGIGGGAFWYFRKRRGSIYSELADDEDMMEETDVLEEKTESVEPQPEETEAQVEEEPQPEEEPPQPEEDTPTEEEPEEEKINTEDGMDDLSDLDPKEDEAK